MGQAAAGQNSGPITAISPVKKALAIGAAVAALALLSYFCYPGHTYLQQDTQIYLPILEREWDHSVFGREPLALYPHVAFTLYDEIAVVLRRITGLDFQDLLAFQQLLFRALGIFGVYLFARSMRVSARMALLAAAAFSLGAFVAGPYVQVLEWEPAPRSFAIPLVFFAIGLASRGRDLAAGIAAAAALLYHPPSALPYWIVYCCLTLAPAKRAVMTRRVWGLAPFLGGVLILVAASGLGSRAFEAQGIFERLDPSLEILQRLRAPYGFVSMWAHEWIWHYAFLFSVALTAFWRLRKRASQEARFFLIGAPLIGALSVPLSYLLLERWKLALAPQLQPARAVLFITAMAGIASALAAIQAGERGRYWESALWFLMVFAIPTSPRVLELLAGIESPGVRLCGLLALELTLLATLAVWADARKRPWAAVPWAAAALAPFLLAPTYGLVRADTSADRAEVRELANWARSSTAKDAVFLFPDAGRELYPGAFRSRALRAVYVDWKGGGQVNFLRTFAFEWWARWQRSGQGKFDPALVASYSSFGINYFVLKREHRLPDRPPVFETARFLVYRP